MGKSEPTKAKDDADASSKPKRVRTGCLTCRERHLKCDEGLPYCQNCRKSSRTCRRGIRLNFMTIDCREPPVLLKSDAFAVNFEDNSREIASEYKGGSTRYDPYDESLRRASIAGTYTSEGDLQSQSSEQRPFQQAGQAPAPPYDGSRSIGPSGQQQPYHQHTGSQSDSGYGSTNPVATKASSHAASEPSLTPARQNYKYVRSPDEALFMQVYIEEVAVWMDSLDPDKHFSRILPFRALEIDEHMLRNAMLACGAQHMWLVNENFREATAQHYYHAAVEEMLARIDSGHHDQELCAVTSSILNVYCLMCEKPLARLSDIAAGRALIEQLKWNAQTTGVGGACFWLNVGMDILSRLHFNSPLPGSLDKWKLNMDFHDRAANQRDEIWSHRIMFLVAQICNFRASAHAQEQQISPQRKEMVRRQRYETWLDLRHQTEQWNECIPRSMHPLSFLEPGLSLSQRTWAQSARSTFPEVYLLKRSNIVARLFYHTAMLLLAQTNPYAPIAGNLDERQRMQEMQDFHATYICGIVAHTKDRGVASVAIRSLAIAAECITELDQRIEVMQIFDQILKHTGWRLGVVMKAIQKGWGWADGPPLEDPKAPTAAEWPNVTTVLAGQQYSLQEGVQMLHDLVLQAETDPLPIPPSRQPFRSRPRPASSHAGSAPSSLQSSYQPQLHMPYTPLQRQASNNTQSTTQLSPQPSPHHPHSISTQSTSPSTVSPNQSFGLPSNTYSTYYVASAPNGTNASDMQFDNGGFDNVGVPQTDLHDLNGFNY